MSGPVESAARGLYAGLWAGLVTVFRVPWEPPTLPAGDAAAVRKFRPAPGYLRYLKFWFWLMLLPMDIAPLVITVVCFAYAWWLGLLVLPFTLVAAVAPDIVAYVAIHLRYDTTWYVLTDRSLRLRRGIWTIHETTITFENVQNVTVRQGPVQRRFGIADVIVQTAGGGGGGHGKHGAAGASHVGLVQGVDNAPEIRDMILARVKRSRTAGLGDEATPVAAAGPAWTPEHLRALREIRAAAAALAGRTPPT